MDNKKIDQYLLSNIKQIVYTKDIKKYIDQSIDKKRVIYHNNFCLNCIKYELDNTDYDEIIPKHVIIDVFSVLFEMDGISLNSVDSVIITCNDSPIICYLSEKYTQNKSGNKNCSIIIHLKQSYESLYKENRYFVPLVFCTILTVGYYVVSKIYNSKVPENSP